MKQYTAVYGHDAQRRIITVAAEDEAAARREIRQQLNRPGRTGYLAVWQRDGEQLILRAEAS